MDLGLRGKVAVITGGSKGIGYACADTFLREGAHVAICARNRERLEDAAGELWEEGEGEVLPIQADMGSREDVKRLMREVYDCFKQLDILVNCAGSSPGGLLEDLTEEQWLTSVNLGPVATDRWDGLEKQMAKDKGITQDEAHALALKSLPLGRICTVQEVADVVVFVASERGSYLNGAMITVDGGQRKA